MRASHHRRKRTLFLLQAKCLQDIPKTRYLLLQAKSAAFYVFAARHGEAGHKALVGRDAERAAALFTLLWRHAVSPCHVAAVVFDFCE